MPCTVKKTFKIAHDTGNHVLVQLKANQSKLFDAVCTVAENTHPTDLEYNDI